MNVSIDLEKLNTYLTPDLGLVALNPALSATGLQDPNALNPDPTVMGSPVLVPNTKYRWDYNGIRYLNLGYILERNGNYESGTFDVISSAVFTTSPGTLVPDGLTPPSGSNYYIPAPLFFKQTMTQQTSGSLGVTFSVMTDSLSVSKPQFGLAFQITAATPAVYPTLRVFVIKSLPLET